MTHLLACEVCDEVINDTFLTVAAVDVDGRVVLDANLCGPLCLVALGREMAVQLARMTTPPNSKRNPLRKDRPS